MLPEKYRLKLTRTPFRGKTYKGQLVTVVVKSNLEPHSRIATIVSRKCSPQAVDRNLIKRRIRHAVLPLASQIPSTDILLIAHPQTLKATFEDIKIEIIKLLSFACNISIK